MAKGTRKKRETSRAAVVPRRAFGSTGHPFYKQLNQILDRAGFDGFCEGHCRRFYHEKVGRPALAPGIYFRLMMTVFSRASTASVARVSRSRPRQVRYDYKLPEMGRSRPPLDASISSDHAQGALTVEDNRRSNRARDGREEATFRTPRFFHKM